MTTTRTIHTNPVRPATTPSLPAAVAGSATQTRPAQPRPGRNVPAVPLLAASLACRTESERLAAAACTLTVGDGVEVDLGRLARTDAALACRLAAYWESCGEMWDRFADGETGLVGLSVSRPLRRAAQTDSRASRADLVAEVDALCALPVVGPLVDELLGSNPDLESIVARGADANLTISDAGANAAVVRFTLPARRPWPASLGGAASRGEYEREFSLKISWAKWRDRRNRRLVTVSVDGREIWAPLA
jgi:hypothetical protein